jgi:adenylate kinase
VRLVLLGPPGAGKGTQARLVAGHVGVPAISTGDIFRANIKNRTELGKLVAHFLSAGELVPDEVTDRMVNERLAQPDATDGFLLDGYPRNAAQVRHLDEILAAEGNVLDAVVQLVAEPEELIARLLNRAVQEGREDDTEDVVRHRQEIYASETAPLVDIYAARGLLVAVDGMGAVDQVTQRLEQALADLQRR